MPDSWYTLYMTNHNKEHVVKSLSSFVITVAIFFYALVNLMIRIFNKYFIHYLCANTTGH